MTSPTEPAHSTIVAVATPRGRGGLGVVRLSGPNALSIAERIFRSKKSLSGRPRCVQYGQFVGGDGKQIDAGLAWFMQGPSSYTGEDTVELSCHGSELVVELLVEAALQHGAVVAERGEFTQRAFLNGRLDLLQAEAVLDVIQAGTRRDLAAALGAAGGRLSDEIRRVREATLQCIVQVEAYLDFADEDIEPQAITIVREDMSRITDSVQQLRQGYEGAKRRRDGWMVLLVGPANVGKSTLLNALAHEERAIVAATPGTTRDWVDARVVWGGELLRIVDTAGLRPGSNKVEMEGVRRTEELATEADVIVLVLDGATPWPTQISGSEIVSKAQVVVLNKQDLGLATHLPEGPGWPKTVVPVSAKTSIGLGRLQEALLEALPRESGEEARGIFRERHDALLSACEQALKRASGALRAEPEKAAADLWEALRQTDELLGEEIGDEVLDRIFQEFCIGK